MAHHVGECPRVMVKCSQCGVDIARGDLSKHNIDNIGAHLRLAIGSVQPARCHLVILAIVMTLMVLLGVLAITIMVDANTNNLIQAITSVHNDLHTNLASLDLRYQEDAAATRNQINTIWQTLDINISRQVDVKMDELIKSLQAKVEVDISSVCELPKYNIKEIRRQLESLKDKVKDKEQSQAVRLQRLTDEILNQIKLLESKVSSVVPLLSEQCQQDVEEMQHKIEEVLERLDFFETLNTTRDGTEHVTKVLADQLLTQPDDWDNTTLQYFNSNISWYQTLNQLSSHSNQIVPVIIKMSNVSEKMKNKEEWSSKPFFAFKGGYKLLLKTKRPYLSLFTS